MGKVEAINFNADGTVRSNEVLTDSIGSTVMMSRGPDGYIYVVTINGTVHKLTFG